MATTKLRDVPVQMLAMGAIAEAAKRLAKSLGAPRSHSVWVRNELGPEEFAESRMTDHDTGEPVTRVPIPRTITPVICVARHPRFGEGLVIPSSFDGFAVREEPWA